MKQTDVQVITDLLKGVNWYTKEEELELLEEGARARFTSESHVRDLIRKAILRYNRYLTHIEFGEYDVISEDISLFFKKCNTNNLRETFRIMKLIDLTLLDIVNNN